jgi:hypothetical protein
METNKLNLGKRDEIIKKCYLKINMGTEKKKKGGNFVAQVPKRYTSNM